VILVGAVAAVFLSIGRRDQVVETNSFHIGELRSIVTELVRSQVLSEANDIQHQNHMIRLANRIDRLEANE
jgi:hypothetical protein